MTLARYCLAFVAVAAAAGAFAQEKKPAAATRREVAKTDAAAEEKAIRATADAFVKAFNAGDAKALAAMWTADGDYVGENGESRKGREAIEKEYEALFAKHLGLKIKLDIESIRLVDASTAVEDGHSTVVADGRPVSQNRYTAIHVKANGHWLLSAVRDMAGAEAAEGGLKDLEFFVGDWVARRDEREVRSNCKWAIGHQFLLRTYEVVDPEQREAPQRTGWQIIGWDPAIRQIRSWNFDSTGGHGQGLWTQVEGGWSIETEGVLADGSPTTSTDLIERVDDNILGWQSIHRTAGGQQLPDTEQVVLERVAASAKTAP